MSIIQSLRVFAKCYFLFFRFILNLLSPEISSSLCLISKAEIMSLKPEPIQTGRVWAKPDLETM